MSLLVLWRWNCTELSCSGFSVEDDRGVGLWVCGVWQSLWLLNREAVEVIERAPMSYMHNNQLENGKRFVFHIRTCIILHFTFYIPLTINIHDFNTVILDRIFLEAHLVLPGNTEKILNGHEVKHSRCPPQRVLRRDKIIYYETAHLYGTDIDQSHCNRSEPMSAIASYHAEQQPSAVSKLWNFCQRALGQDLFSLPHIVRTSEPNNDTKRLNGNFTQIFNNVSSLCRVHVPQTVK